MGTTHSKVCNTVPQGPPNWIKSRTFHIRFAVAVQSASHPTYPEANPRNNKEQLSGTVCNQYAPVDTAGALPLQKSAIYLD